MKDKKNKHKSSTPLTGSPSITANGASLSTSFITTTGTFSFNSYNKILKDTKFINNNEGNFIEITYLKEPTYSTWPSPSHKSMIKEIYGVVDKEIKLIKTINGIENPGYYVEPNVEWDD